MCIVNIKKEKTGAEISAGNGEEEEFKDEGEK